MSFFWITSYVINPLAFFHLFPLTMALLIATPRTGHTQVLEQDSLALVAFYNSTGGPGWTNNTGWLTGPVGTWYGVTVEGSRVVKLIVYDNNLNGIMPEEIGNLSELVVLSIGYDIGLSGLIPQGVYQLFNLEKLGIYNCPISGILSTQIGFLVSLNELLFRGTNIAGYIPSEVGNLINLKYLTISESEFSGPIPSEIGNLDSLLILDLHDNQLSGSIPETIGNCTQLQQIRLGKNQLSGPIPESIGQCTQLSYLSVSDNQLEGDIPEALGALTIYGDLFFHNNRFTGIPPWNHNWYLNALWIQYNCMTFEDIEPHFVGYWSFEYCPQDSMAQRIDTVVPQGSSISIYSGTLGEFTTYYWTHNGEQIPDTENADTLQLTNLTPADAGEYQCLAQNSKCFRPDGQPMVLLRRPVHLDVSVGTSEANAPFRFSTFPNPATQHVTVEATPQPVPVIISLADVQGRRVARQVLPAGETRLTLSVAGLERGVYLLTATGGSGFFKEKIIVNR